ncbi:TetR/AcrR family transcriptional regulator [Tumebacillus sp. BK434]|uniref:TetR/AcrR family transcriptional regulator n=1 Tax=Tumebacillus sp. BK434 TaxID=2512169 RepID=UPI001FB4C2A7|nr:TetR/AcrR family transcriptional regulator [Tumebacillus sp. BK434]
MQKKEVRQERILTEAARLFVEKGYEQTTVSDIVKACEMARGTFYLYFDSLESVLTELFRNTTELLWDEIVRISGNSLVGDEVLKTIITALFRALAEKKELLQVYRSGGGHDFQLFKHRAFCEGIGNRVVDLIKQGQEACELRVFSPVLVSQMIVSLVDSMAYYALVLEEGKLDLEQVVEELCDFILYGISK